MTDKIMLIDGHSILNRAFYGIPDLTDSQGRHTNAVLGFLNIMLRYVEEEQPTHLLVAFDRKEPTFRHLRYDAYKGNRSPMPKELTEQVPLMKEVLAAMEIPVVDQAGIEADDILGTIGVDAVKEGLDVVTVSGDRDLLQLAADHVRIKIPKTRGGKTVTEDYDDEAVKELYGVSPKEFIEMKGLMGDSSDNIPGVPGIGEKTASKIISTWHSIENAYDHIEEIKPARARNNLNEYYDQAIMSRDLATIKTDCQLDYHFQDARIGTLFNSKAYKMFKELELKSLLHYFEEDQKASDGTEIQWTADSEASGQVFAAVQACGMAGLGILEEEGHYYAVSLAWKENDELKNHLIPVGDVMSVEDLKERVIDLLRQGVRLAVMDYKALLYFDVRARDYESLIDDVGVMAYLLNPIQSSFDYEDLARDYLKETLPSRKEIYGKEKISGGKDSLEEGDEKACLLASALASVPLQTVEKLKKRLEKEKMWDLYQEIDHPLTPALYDMEYYGITVERDALADYGSRLVGRIDELEKSIWDKAGREFNINSPKQLGVILFEEMKLPFAKKTKTGYSTSADVLDKLAPDYPVVSEVLEYRQLTKLKSTYADGLIAFVLEDGKIHGRFHQKVTATGRLSSSDPNLQNIPVRLPLGREIRKVFVPEPGYVFVSADYSQIELRILAHMAGDDHLIEAYHQDKDIHRLTASQVFGVPLDEVTPMQRRSAKAVNFGIVYGISAFGLGQDLDITRKEAQDYIARYFATYPGIKSYLDGNVAFAKEHGYTRTLYGRIRPLPELKSRNFAQRAFGERAAMNSSIQGTAADIIKIAMIRVSQRLRREKLESRMILQIHDELLIETRENEIDIVKKILTEEMMGAADLKVPLSIDIETGRNWYEAK